jgi:REP element-mobilizing transposase RayT
MLLTIYIKVRRLKNMKYDLDKGSHSVYLLQYHFVQCIKYRKKVFINENIIDTLKTHIRRCSDSQNVKVLNVETDKDHFHMLFRCNPTTNIPKYINLLKTITSREIKKKHDVSKILWNGKFWSPSYFLATTGGVTLDILMDYVNSQGKPERSKNA